MLSEVSETLQEFTSLTWRSHQFNPTGEKDENGLSETDMDRSDYLWKAMTSEEQELSGKLSEDLYRIADGKITQVIFLYTNWQGKLDSRKVIPYGFSHKATQYHPKPQWILLAFCLDRGQFREFALKDIQW